MEIAERRLPTLQLDTRTRMQVITVNFIQHMGQDLWPYGGCNRSHLNDTWEWCAEFRTMSKIRTHQWCGDQNVEPAEAGDQSLFEQKLNSALGQAMLGYVQIIWNMMRQERDMVRDALEMNALQLLDAVVHGEEWERDD